MKRHPDFQVKSRREFLVKSTAILGGLSLTPCAMGQVLEPRKNSAPPPKRATASRTLRLGAAHTTDWVKNDTNASIDRDASGNIWMIIGGNEWAIYKGAGMDQMVLQHASKPNFARPRGDDLYWPSGLWIDPTDGKWYCAVHCEYNYGVYTTGKHTAEGKWSPDHRRRMALATSTDSGKTWAMAGDIITGDNSDDPAHYTGDYYDKGAGDAHIFIDDHFFYAFYREGWYKKSNNRFYEVVRAARCAKRDRMAPGKWRKWYAGSWAEPGLGGHDTDVFNSNTADTAYVFYSTHLKKFIALIGAGDPDNPEGYLAMCNDLNVMDWTDPIRYCDAQTHQWYNWAVDAKTFSRHIIDGNSFHYYTSTHSVPIWREVSFVAAPSSPTVKPPLYPPDSVDDRNPGWDRNYRKTAT